ncbi:MAG: SMP-30/gluconolactonase/LRE family protein [Kiritimatiellae bacterium]|nr:SMP-30/gluconolactonase/LRE family protein [Kiritimatiellia bacterium]
MQVASARFGAIALFFALLGSVCAGELHYLADRDGSAVQAVSNAAPSELVDASGHLLWSVAYDPHADHVYWSDLANGAIRRCNSDGTSVTTVVQRAGAVYRGIVPDGRHNRLYYLDSESNTLNVAAMDGSDETVLLSGLRRPNDLALDPLNGKLYLTDSGQDKVICCDTNGGGEQTVLSGAAIDGVWGIALIPERGEMYLSAHGTNAILRAGLDGSALTNLVTGMETPRGLTADPHHQSLYWVEAESGSVYSAKLDGSESAAIMTNTFPGSRGLVSYESTDRDGDLLPDTWEIAQFGSLDQAGSDDYDGDLLSNLAEHLFGSSPTNSGDTMPLIMTEGLQDHGSGPVPTITLCYEERLDAWVSYATRYRTNLLAGSWALFTNTVDSVLTNVSGEAGTRIITIDASQFDGNAPHFFRVDGDL